MLQWTWGCRHLFEVPISVLLRVFLEVQLLDHIVVLMFWGTSKVFFHSGRTNLHPTNWVQGFPFLHIQLFKYFVGHLSIFGEMFGQVFSPFFNWVIWGFCLFGFWFSRLVWVTNTFLAFTLHWIYDLQMPSRALSVAFSLGELSPLLCRSFFVSCHPLVWFCSCCLCFRCPTQEVMAKANVQPLFPIFF